MKVVGLSKIVDVNDMLEEGSCGNDNDYYELFMEPIRKCKYYKPKLGGNDADGVDLDGFKSLYGSDSFYSWIGLDSELMYSAHKAAGGMTSIYRQIGIGCERLFRQIIMDTCLYDDPFFSNWSYESKTSGGKVKTLYLDGRLELNEIKNEKVLYEVKSWMQKYCDQLGVPVPLNGVVFEVRQGYKSKDSKRQNGDIDNATVAWANGYLPIFAIFSAQIDKDIVYRYINNRCGILTGINESDAGEFLSLFSFFRKVLGYDLAGFFQRNSDKMKVEINSVLAKLLSPQ